MLRLRRKIAVAQPPAALAGGAVCQHIDGVLRKRLFCSPKDALRLLVGKNGKLLHIGVFVREKHGHLRLGIPEDDGFHIHHRIGFEGEQLILPGRKRIFQRIHGAHPPREDGMQLIKEEIDGRFPLRPHMQRDKPRLIAGEGVLPPFPRAAVKGDLLDLAEKMQRKLLLCKAVHLPAVALAKPYVIVISFGRSDARLPLPHDALRRYGRIRRLRKPAFKKLRPFHGHNFRRREAPRPEIECKAPFLHLISLCKGALHGVLFDPLHAVVQMKTGKIVRRIRGRAVHSFEFRPGFLTTPNPTSGLFLSVYHTFLPPSCKIAAFMP